MANNGQNRSGFAVESTYGKINENVTAYTEELIKQISDNIKDYEIILDENELEMLFVDIEISLFGLIESLMRKRKEYLEANKLEDSRMDYKTIMIQNCSNKLNAEKNNLKVKMLFITEKIKRKGINIIDNNGQVNVAIDNGTITAGNNTTQPNNIVKLKFYLAEQSEISDTINKHTIKDIKEPDWIDLIKGEIRDLADKIQAIKLSKKVYPEKKEELNNGAFKLFDKPLLTSSVFQETTAGLKEDEKSNIIEQLKRVFDIEINKEEFFYIGELVKTTVPDLTISGIYFKSQYKGEDTEIEKVDLINDLIYKLKLLETYNNFVSYLNEFCLIPLVLVNEGKILNSGLEIKIKIPCKYTLLDIASQELIISSYLLEHDGEKLINSIIAHKENSKVKSFPKKFDLKEPINMFLHRTTSDEIEEEKRLLENLFSYELYQENEFNILKYSFTFKTDTLRPREIMALPTYLFVKADEVIKIQYEIISDQSIDNEFDSLTYNV